MMSNIIEKMKAKMAVKTAKKMDFKSEDAERKFEVIREHHPSSAEFVEDWARLMQTQMKKRADEDVTDSVLWNTYSMVQACHENGVDLYKARALLTMYWQHGDQLVARDKLA